MGKGIRSPIAVYVNSLVNRLVNMTIEHSEEKNVFSTRSLVLLWLQ